MDSNKKISEVIRLAADLRQNVMEFQGLEREFLHLQDNMIQAYERSAGVKHPGNLGAIREDLLRDFLRDSGLIPRRYGISEASARVISTSGHASEEIDILFYDAINGINLVKYPSVEFYPVESVYGIIQVKSCIRSTDAVKTGLENVASFRRLSSDAISSRGFGILFAYDCALSWESVVQAIEEFRRENPPSAWPNAVVLLSKGIILSGNGSQAVYRSSGLELLSSPNSVGLPNRGETLLTFYRILSELLKTIPLQSPNVENYARLPLVAGPNSYRFTLGPFGEIGTCPKHGSYLRQIDEPSLRRIIETCEITRPLQWLQALDLAAGLPGNDDDKYSRQPGFVRIFNPDKAHLAEILMEKDRPGSLTYHAIDINGEHYWIPYCYAASLHLVRECPKCE